MLAALLVVCGIPALAAADYDLVVYGGTASGVMTAISAAREGLQVALVEPTGHIGGMVTGGLSATDHGRKSTVGGIAREFYKRVGKEYGKEIFWYPEPKVAERVLNKMLGETSVKLLLRSRLREKGGVVRSGSKLEAIVLENGTRLQGKTFADCSYEGDLMAQAGVKYTIGREGSKQYGEELAGVRPKDRNHQFDVKIPARDAQGKLLPEIQSEPRGEIGSADKRVQAYNYRLIFSSDPANRVAYSRPERYQPARFELLVKLIEALTESKGRVPRANELLIFRTEVPNAKADINNRGAFSTDYIGKSYDYPDGSYARRDEIARDHIDYTKGLLYFMANDARVPQVLRDEMKKWGLAKDEFTDNGNWPYQLYVREGRRMIGDFVMTQKDMQTTIAKPDVIGMGSYNSDSHNVQRFVQEDGTVQNEGNMEVRVEPYHVPYRVIVPKKAQAVNLLVPVCFSASHVTYSSMRMEPVYMMIGQAAGVAASMAIREKKAVQDVDTTRLVKKLKDLGLVDRYVPGDPEDQKL